MNAAFPWPLATLSDIPSLFWLAPVAGLAALLMARFFSASVMRKSEGDAEMVRIAQAVREGAIAYLKRQYRVVAIVFLILIVFLGLLAALGLQPKLSMLGVPLGRALSELATQRLRALLQRSEGGVRAALLEPGLRQQVLELSLARVTD